MRLKSPITLPAVIDLHVHLRQDAAMMALAVKAARDGGTQTVYVMVWTGNLSTQMRKFFSRSHLLSFVTAPNLVLRSSPILHRP
jgi:dihydroorotase-like cyclic amidohydrolase